jgi:hypothetical protein
MLNLFMRILDVKKTRAIQNSVLNFINVSNLSKMQLISCICYVDSYLRSLHSVNVGSAEETGTCFLVTEKIFYSKGDMNIIFWHFKFTQRHLINKIAH